MQVDIEAPAKINLFLAVRGKRPDGYHELLTVMQALTLCDLVSVRLNGGNGIRLRCEGETLPENEDNLAYRAAALFLERAAIAAGVEIVLRKRIPVAAGLGGGSSDAAAVLLALNRLSAGLLKREALLDLGAGLGADVPFFVSGQATVLATGRGDILQPIRCGRSDWVVLANPGFSVSTRWVYENFALTSRGRPFNVGPDFSAPEDIARRLADGDIVLHNDLELVTCARHPELERLKIFMLRRGASGVLMSGSGPTIFALFREQATAEAAALDLRREKAARVFVARFKG